MLLDLKRFRCLFFIGRFNDIWLSVMPIFVEPVYENGIISVSYIAENTCDNYVIATRNPLTV